MTHTNEELQQALANLETFSQQIEKELVPNLSNFAVHGGKLVVLDTPSLKKTITQAYSNLISPKPNEHLEVLTTLLQSSDTIKSYFPLIQVMSEGSSEQKKFANYAKTAIERFNRTVDETSSSSWPQRIIRFLYQKSASAIGNRLVKIELPRNAFLHTETLKFSDNRADQKKITSTLQFQPILTPALQKIAMLSQAVLPTLQMERRTYELYQMKIIALLEKEHLLSPMEARELILRTPTDFKVDQEAEHATISQQLCPIPGQSIHVSATFQIDRRTRSFSIFQSDNLFVESTQTGFPHPLQHNGWALSEVLIPKCLHRPQRLIHFPQLYERQLEVAQELLGPLSEKTRYFLAMKRRTFEENRVEFLKAHKALTFAIAAAAPQTSIPHEFSESVDSFFAFLATSNSPYDLLAQAQEQLMEGMVKDPYISLESEWLNGTLTNLESSRAFLVQNMEKAIASWNERIVDFENVNNGHKWLFRYCIAMGKILAAPIEQLLLQQHSEKMKVDPPELDLFSKKLQVALYLQLWEFQHELSLQLDEVDPYRHFSRLLEDDLQLFRVSELQRLPWKSVAVVNELEAYYKERAREAGCRPEILQPRASALGIL